MAKLTHCPLGSMTYYHTFSSQSPNFLLICCISLIVPFIVHDASFWERLVTISFIISPKKAGIMLKL
jgi:hypothetical protein